MKALILIAVLLMAGTAQAAPDSPTNCIGDGKLNVVNRGNVTDLFYGAEVFRCTDKFGCVMVFLALTAPDSHCEGNVQKTTISPYDQNIDDKLARCRKKAGCDEEKGCKPQSKIISYTCR